MAIAPDEDAPAPRGEKINLKLNLPKGEKRSLNSDMDMKMSMTAAGQAFDIGMKMGTGMSVVCQDVNAEGIHTLKMTYDKLRMAMLMGGAPLIDYDSSRADNAPNPVTGAFEALVGGELIVKMKPTGETVAVEGLDELAEKAAKKAPGQNAAQLKEQIKGMAQSFEQMQAAYPKEPVDIRDSWESELDMTTDPNMPMKVKAKYTLYDRKDGVAIIKVDGTISSTAGLKGTMKGTMNMDEKTGWIKGGDMDMKLAGTMNDPNAGQIQMSMTGKIKMSDK